MAMTAVFTTIGGQMYHENRGGTESLYIPDPLGNLIACKDTSGTTTYTAEYWPYGEVRTESGANPSKWGFVGLLGYLVDFASLLYVRMRFFKPNLGRWSTVDPLWPKELPYAYAQNNPTSLVDPLGLYSGTLPLIIISIPGLREFLLLLLGITLAVLLLLLAIYGLIWILTRFCKALRQLMKNTCGDPDGRECDCSGGGCNWSDSCLTLWYKGAAYERCAALRMLEIRVCYFLNPDPNHVRHAVCEQLSALRCASIFVAKGCMNMGGPNPMFVPW